MRRDMDKKKTKKPYVKPDVRKNKPVAVVASSCNAYSSRAVPGTYYH
jgi:hypothetical protein